MSEFVNTAPSLDAYWRSIILFGRNAASYKFALGQSLLELAHEGKAFVALDELARPYAQHLVTHLQMADRQGTAPSSRFLDACRSASQDELTEAQLIEETVRLGFVNVLDAFHTVNQAEVPVRFFIDDRRQRGGITFTDELYRLLDDYQGRNLPYEVEARWRLVETAWSLDINPRLLSVKYSPDDDILFVEETQQRRIDVTSCREALNGYQKGKCFYCFSDISIEGAGEDAIDVDHFFPHVLVYSGLPETINIDGVWNLVLSCQTCNRGQNGKFARVPDVRYLERLQRRNNYLIDSHHPLRETLINQTGRSAEARADFLKEMDLFAIERLVHRWRASDEQPPVF